MATLRVVAAAERLGARHQPTRHTAASASARAPDLHSIRSECLWGRGRLAEGDDPKGRGLPKDPKGSAPRQRYGAPTEQRPQEPSSEPCCCQQQSKSKPSSSLQHGQQQPGAHQRVVAGERAPPPIAPATRLRAGRLPSVARRKGAGLFSWGGTEGQGQSATHGGVSMQGDSKG